MAMLADIGRVQVHPATTGVQARVPYDLADTYWGYVVRPQQGVGLGVMLAQGAAWCVGIAFVIAGAGLWVLPATAETGALLPLRFAVSVVFFALAAMCLWYASRGTQIELQIDTALGEVREVVRNKAGKPTLVGRHGFDSFGAVHLDRQPGAARPVPGHALLVLRFRSGPEGLVVAEGPESRLVGLRDRLARDLIVRDKPGSSSFAMAQAA
jgi:hypothetical protein